MSAPKSMGEYLALPEAEKMRLAALPTVRSEPLLDALSSSIQTIADEAFGPFPTQTANDNLTEIERGIAKQRQELAALRDELTRLSDVVCAEDRASILRVLLESNKPGERICEPSAGSKYAPADGSQGDRP